MATFTVPISQDAEIKGHSSVRSAIALAHMTFPKLAADIDAVRWQYIEPKLGISVSYGAAWQLRKVIGIRRSLLTDSSQEYQAFETACHELAHIIAKIMFPCSGNHDFYWGHIMILLGRKPEVTVKL